MKLQRDAPDVVGAAGVKGEQPRADDGALPGTGRLGHDGELPRGMRALAMDWDW